MVFADPNIDSRERLTALSTAWIFSLFYLNDKYWQYAYTSVLVGLWLVMFVRMQSRQLWPLTIVAIFTVLTNSQFVAIVLMFCVLIHEIIFNEFNQ